MQGLAGPSAAPNSGYPPTREVIDLTLDEMDVDKVIPIPNPTVSFLMIFFFFFSLRLSARSRSPI